LPNINNTILSPSATKYTGSNRHARAAMNGQNFPPNRSSEFAITIPLRAKNRSTPASP
jgi:hypothetical protein